MSILAGKVAVGGRPQLGEVGKGTGRARLGSSVLVNPSIQRVRTKFIKNNLVYEWIISLDLSSFYAQHNSPMRYSQ